MNKLTLNYFSRIREIFWALILMILVSFNSFAQSTVTGTVTDEFGVPLLGATVILQGTTTGSTTDFDGKYAIPIPSGSASLNISYVGYLSQTIVVGGRSVLDVSLQPDTEQLSEVVVIGYGTQLETRVTGSIGKADPEEMARVSVPTIGQALQGRVAGVNIKNQNGQPGSNKTAINIRGFGTPLFIVDGLPVDEAVFAALNPNDIEALNILKDAASAAVYGARAGNGVVLVTTKRGTTGPTKFSIRTETGLQGLTTTPNSIDSWQHMALNNIRAIDRGQPIAFSQQMIQDFRTNQGLDDENFPNVNMFDLVVRDNAPMTTHDLSIRGGAENIRYFVSGNLFDQTGLEQNVFGKTDTRFKRYQLRGNLDVNVTEKFDFNLDMSFNVQDFFGPRNQMEGTSWGQGQGIFARAGRWRPFFSTVELPGGHADFPRGAPGGQTVNPLNLASTELGGSQDFQREFIDVKFGGKYQIIPGLSTRGVLNYQSTNLQAKLFQKEGPEYRYDPNTEQHVRVRALNADTRVERRNSQIKNLNFQYFLEGDHSIGKHSIQSMYVFEYILQQFERVDASRIQYQFEIPQLSAGPPSQQFNNDFINRNKRVGHIGKVSYNYDNKYSLEVSARYDGSMRFPKDSRWGLFPSLSGAWNISEESFIKNSEALDFIRTLKLRASWGRLGFDAAGDFQFLSTFSFNDFMIFQGNNLSRTIVSDGLTNPEITWEKMDLTNLGMDFNFFAGKLEGSFDVFERKRFDVLGIRNLDFAPVVGADLPETNFQQLTNRGIEMSLRHSNRINDNWNYSIGGNIGISEEIVNFTDEPDFINKEVERREKQIGRRAITGGRGNVQPFYLETDGLFTSQAEIDNWADIDGNGNRSIQIGDLKVVDRDGDGRITAGDRYLATSGTQARMTFGFQTRLAWKGFEVSTFWQGASRFGYNLLWSEFGAPFPSDGIALSKDINNAYIPANDFGLPTVSAADARWPRASGIFNQAYDAFLIDGTYLRLKQLQVAYNFSPNALKQIGLNNMKLYVGGTNLITFSNIDFLDPEIDEAPAQFFGNYHPQTRVYSVGLEISF